MNAADAATWNRLRLIPFEVTIPAGEIDRYLPRKLSGEAEGILAWAMEGAVRWHRHGLRSTPELERACERWLHESDQLARFLGDCCVSDRTAPIPARAESRAVASRRRSTVAHEIQAMATELRRRRIAVAFGADQVGSEAASGQKLEFKIKAVEGSPVELHVDTNGAVYHCATPGFVTRPARGDFVLFAGPAPADGVVRLSREGTR